MLTALLCLLALPKQEPAVTARLQVQTGSWAYQGGAVSPDGTVLATINGGNQGTEPPCLWEVATGRQILTFQPPPSTLMGDASFGFSADGLRLAALTQAGMAVWETHTGKLLQVEEDIRSAVYRQGAMIAATESQVFEFNIQDFSRKPVGSLAAAQTPIFVDNKLAAASGPQGEVTLLAPSKQPVDIKLIRKPMAAHRAGADAVLFNLVRYTNGVGEMDWALVDLKKSPPAVIAFKADQAIAFDGGVLVREDKTYTVRRVADWSKSAPVTVPSDAESVDWDSQHQRFLVKGPKSVSWLDPKDFKVLRTMPYAVDFEWLSLADLHFSDKLGLGIAIPNINAFMLGGSPPDPVVFDSKSGAIVASMTSFVIPPSQLKLTAEGTRLAADYFPGSEGFVRDGTSTWDLETGRLLPPLAPNSPLIPEAIPESSAREVLVRIENGLYSLDLLTGKRSLVFESDEFKDADVLAFFNDLIIASTEREVKGEEEGTIETVTELLLINWQLDPVEVSRLPYQYFFDVTQADGSGNFWLCADGRILRFTAAGGASQKYEDLPLPHLEKAAKQHEGASTQLLDTVLDISATPDDSLLLAIGRADFFRLRGEAVNDGIIYENFGSAQILRAAANEWVQIDVGREVPVSGALSKDGQTAYITTRDSRLLKCSTTGLNVVDSLVLDSAGGSVALDEVNGFAYVETSTSIHLIDLKTWTLAATLVVMKDGSWAVIAPDGRFDASQLDRTQGLNWVFSDQPTHPLPIEVLMRDYYEPRLLPRILARETLPVIKPVSEVLRDLPVVTIKETKIIGEAKIDVCVSIDARSASAHDLRLARDGQLVGQLDGEVCAKGQRKEVWLRGLNLPRSGAKSTEFSAYVFNKERAKCETAATAVAIDLPAKKGRGMVMAIGVNKYEDESWNLQFAANDAELSALALEATLDESGLFEEVGAATFISDADSNNATKEALQEAFASLAEPIRPEDTLVIHWAGHGYAAPNGIFYLIPSSTGPSFDVRNPDHLKKAISSDELTQWLRPIDAGQIIMIVDACHSAATVQAEGFKPGPMGARGLGQLAYDKGMMILAATQTADVALESGEIGHGLLTFSLAVIGLIGGEEDGGLVFSAFSDDGKTASFRDLFRVTELLVPLLHEEIKSGARPLARTSRVTASKDNRAGTQKPQIFDFSRRQPPRVLGRG